MFPLICFLFLLGSTAWCDAQNITSHSLTKIGPLTLAAYEGVGSQEVVYVEVPQEYLPFVAYEWYVGITTNDGSSADTCPHVVAAILMRSRGIPIPNPNDAAVPPNTWIAEDTIEGRFEIKTALPKQDKYIMVFNDTSNSTGEYYMSAYLIAEVEDGQSSDASIPDQCKYIVQLSVLSYDNVYAMPSVNQLQPIDVDQRGNSDFLLEPYRNGLLSTEFMTAKEGYNVSLNSPVKLSWIIQTYSDVGGTLKITLGFNETAKSLNGTAVIRGCTTWAANGTGTSSGDRCDAGYLITVNGSESQSETWFMPFPKSGPWVLEVTVECVDDNCEDEYNIKVDVDVIQCIESCHSDKSQGTCKIYRTDVLLFSACNCKGGWQGIACTDGSRAVPRSQQLLMTLLLTLSNLIFLPCGILAIMRQFYSESVVYFFVMLFSTFYHACDNDFVIAYCIAPYNTLQYSDFYGSITAMWVTLIAVAKLPFKLESIFHVLGIMAIGVAVTYNRFSALTTLIPVLCGLFILAVKWGRKCRSTHACYPAKKEWVFSIIPGVVCSIVGFILFAFVETPENYFYTHSLWHILMGCAVLFLIPKEKKFFRYDDMDLVSDESVSISGTQYNNVTTDVTTFHIQLSDDSS